MRHREYDMADAPLDDATLAAIPSDYGLPPSGPLLDYLAMPPDERPPAGEYLRLLANTRPAKPCPDRDTPVIEEWTRIPPTTPANHIAGGSALNIRDPFGRPGGDWHNGWHYGRYAYQPPRTATLSGTDGMTPAERFVDRHVLGTRRVADVRAGLRAMGHPDADAASPIWGATHERSTVRYVLRTVLGHHAPSPDQPELLLDRRTACRWLGTDEQVAWARMVLTRVAAHLPPARQQAIEAWVRHTFDHPRPTE